MRNKPIIYIPDITPSIEEMMLLSIDGNAPKEDVEAILSLNSATSNWFYDEIDTETYLDQVEELSIDGVSNFLDRFDLILTKA
jgi:hypothetical protein